MENANGSTTIRERLFALRDEKYAAFQLKLTPGLEPPGVIGVRAPELRRLARELEGTPEAEAFIRSLPHGYYDENNLHGFIISLEDDYKSAVEAVDNFLPYVDNWATCDLLCPKSFKKHTDELVDKILEWTASMSVYTIRFGLETLMRFYLDDPLFKTEYLDLASSVRTEEYYVSMMTAWFFATALAKQYDAALPYIEGRRLERRTHNRAIQKAVESRRITDGQKAYLRTLRLK